MSNTSPIAMDTVEAVLPTDGAGLSSREIHSMVSSYKFAVVSYTLRALIESGRAECKGNNSRRLYRRVPA